MPIAGIAHTAAHEFGHDARGREAGFGTLRLDVTRWPWPIPIANASLAPPQRVDPARTHPEQMAFIAGGSEAGRVQADWLVDKIYSGDEVNYFDWLELIYASLDTPLYIWLDLRPSRLRDFHSYLDVNSPPLDPRQYALEFALVGAEAKFGYVAGPTDLPRFDEVKAVATGFRRRAWLNIADFSLLSAIVRTFDFARTGIPTSSSPAITVGRCRFVPSGRFDFTPLGAESGIDVRFLLSKRTIRIGTGYLETPSQRRLWSESVEVVSRDRAHLGSEVLIEVWQREHQRLGVRGEVGLSKTIKRQRFPLIASFKAGFKTDGYSLGTPMRGGFLGSVGAGIHF
jgi:hypothetical protein